MCKTSIVSVYVGKTTRPILGNKTVTQWPRPLSRRNFIANDTISSFVDTSLVGLIKRRRRRRRRRRRHRWSRHHPLVPGTISGPASEKTHVVHDSDANVMAVFIKWALFSPVRRSFVPTHLPLFFAFLFICLLLSRLLFVAVVTWVCYTPITKENVRRLYCLLKLLGRIYCHKNLDTWKGYISMSISWLAERPSNNVIL